MFRWQLTVLVLAGAFCAQAAGQSREQLEKTFAEELEKIAAICDQYKLPEEAKTTRQWLLKRDPARQYLFDPYSVPSVSKPTNSASIAGKWYSRFEQARKDYAEMLFQAAKRKAAEDETISYQWLNEVIYHDPSHAMARRILGLTANPAKRVSVRPGRSAPRDLGWRARKYLEVNTPNFRVFTNVDRKQAENLAHRLDECYLAWSQLFFENWARPGSLAQRLNGGGSPIGLRRKFNVVYFQSRDEYVGYLKRWEPRIEISVGYYSDRKKTAYFYASEQPRTSIWYHEVTHQLFQESTSAKADVGGKNNFWLVEGIAMYLESLRRFDGYFTVGGFDADRLQYARYRKFNERFYIPLKQLLRLGREELKENQDIRRIYTQSAGLIHFLMDSEGGRLRPALRDYLRIVYQKSDTPLTFPQLMGDKLQGIDERYHDFLKVANSDVEFIGTPDQVKKLSLGHTSIDDVSLQALKSYANLEWLDLAYTNVTDNSTSTLLSFPKLDQLNLEGTKVTDKSATSIGELKLLTQLDLSGTAITDETLKAVGKLTNLTDLWLTGTKISDAGLAHLTQLKKLTILNVEQTQVSAAALSKLRSQLPALEK